MPKQLAEAQTKLENVEHQLETAKTEVNKPFAQEAELAEKLERLSVLNALLNMDEKGEKAVDGPVLYPVQIAGRSNTVGNGSLQGLKPAVGIADKPVQKASLKEKLEAYKAQVGMFVNAIEESAKNRPIRKPVAVKFIKGEEELRELMRFREMKEKEKMNADK